MPCLIKGTALTRSLLDRAKTAETDKWTLTIIYLPRELLRCYPDHRSIERGLGAMVTYYDLFTFVIMLCSVITLVIMILNNRK